MYKYIALCGVAIMAITLVFSVSELFRVEDQILSAKERIEIMTARLEAGKNTEGGEPGSELDQSLDRIRLESARTRLEVLENRSLEMRQWATISFTIGIVAAAFGFTRWYRKIQVPMERITRHQAEQYVTRADTD
jgi:hypothetical protein